MHDPRKILQKYGNRKDYVKLIIFMMICVFGHDSQEIPPPPPPAGNPPPPPPAPITGGGLFGIFVRQIIQIGWTKT